MKLSKILEKISFTLLCGDTDFEIKDICYDSRKAADGFLFVAMSGTNVDGHTFIESAYKNGARAFVVEKDFDFSGFKDSVFIRVSNAREALALMSKNFFDKPDEKMKMIGITGTKGKSSITCILKTVLDRAGFVTGTIGTTGVSYADITETTVNTTPESYETYRILDEMYKKGCQYVIMEVSSQGLMMHRVDGIMYDIGVFTNLSPDHIGKGEHDSFEHYLSCKAMLWDRCKMGIANCDDKHFYEITKNAKCPIKTFAVHSPADFSASNVSLWRQGKQLGVSFMYSHQNVEYEFNANVPGEFTVYNALSVISVAKELNVSYEIIKEALKNIEVKGRMEIVGDTKDYSIIIDYAHNAVSLETILKTIRKYKPDRIVCLFGCGGNRPKMRRFEMGEISGKYADFTIITSDNARFENPEEIINDILVGINKTNGEYISIVDRKEAIHYAIDNAKSGDIILIAGKGHEMYQEINGVKHDFNEKQIILDYLKLKA